MAASSPAPDATQPAGPATTATPQSATSTAVVGQPSATPDATSTEVAEPPPESGVDTPAGAIVFETFDGPDGTPLIDRVPDHAPAGVAWSANTRRYHLGDGSVGSNALIDVDQRAIIHPAAANILIRAEVARVEGLVGIVFRYQDEENWFMAFHDGKDFVIGRLLDRAFSEVEREVFPWEASSDPRVFEVLDLGESFHVLLDGRPIASVQDATHAGNTGVGMFLRATENSRFDEFTVLPYTSGSREALAAAAAAGSELASIELGRQVFLRSGCTACHTVSSEPTATGVIGPALEDVATRAGATVPGLGPTAYLTESIREPGAHVVEGFVNLMPAFRDSLPEAELTAIVAYLLTLGEPSEQTGPEFVIDVPEGALVFDTLSGEGPLDSREPSFGPPGAAWLVEAGDWQLAEDGARELTGVIADHRATLDAGVTGVTVGVDLHYDGGFGGLVIRYQDFENWVMVWYDAAIEQLLVGQRLDGSFNLLPSIPFPWGGSGVKRRLTVVDEIDELIIAVDRQEVARRQISGLETATRVGIFTRDDAVNLFTNFTIRSAAPTLPAFVEFGTREPQAVIPAPPDEIPNIFEPWRDQRTTPGFLGSFVDAGYRIEELVTDGIAHPSSLLFDGDLLYITATELIDGEKGAVYVSRLLEDGALSPPVLYAAGFHRPTGLAAVDGDLIVSSRGIITRLSDDDGDLVADVADVIIGHLPFGRFDVPGEAADHQTHGLTFGPDGRVYAVQGARTDRGPVDVPYEGTVISFNPDGSDIQVFAEGVRNPFDLAFNSSGELFTLDNGANAEGELQPPDELNHIVDGAHYGWPDIHGQPPEGAGTVPPLLEWFPNVAPAGMTFYNGDALPTLTDEDLLFAKWNPQVITRIRLGFDGVRYLVVEEEDVVSGFGNPPTDITVGPDGFLYIADWGGGRIFRIRPG